MSKTSRSLSVFLRRLVSGAVDLSHTVESHMPVYPGDVTPVVERVKTIRKDGLNLTKITCGAHAGTHIDAPIHFFEGGASADHLSPTQFIGEALVLDLSDKPVGSGISGEDLQRHGRGVNGGNILLLYTGSSEHWGEESILTKYTYLEKSGAEWLVKKKVKAVGIDSLSVERYGAKEPVTHKILLTAGVGIIESLNRNLKTLAGERVFLIGLPLKIKDSDGGPVRVLAYPLD